MHDRESLQSLKHCWIRNISSSQPIDSVEQYFGIEIALYFAWLGHYTTALVFPAVFGFVSWVILPTKFSSPLTLPIMALLTMLWSTVSLESWKRTNSYYSYRWGTLDRQPCLLEEPRSAFRGNLEASPITGRLERFYPRWRRYLTICTVTIPVVLLALLIAALVAVFHIHLQEIVESKASQWSFFGAGFLPFLPLILYSLVIIPLNEIYRKVANWLTNLENHRLDEENSNALIAKLIVFQFVNSFFASFHIAFFRKDLELLRQHLIAMLVTRQIRENCKEYFLPYGQTRLRQVWLSINSDAFQNTGLSVSKDDHPDNKSDATSESVYNSETSVRQRKKTGISSGLFSCWPEYSLQKYEKLP